ncbi:hypothetical protein [Bacillus sp. RO1]|uniref:hypothetical protein n=1 Tax=Bacillus sp. RO1 TaxID=2722703 RepID=UPI001456F323|nr:hypothetical protein [Bacillus sp. RO1]NLP51281.1 hypothetical protein [Bacillus sp. RO1]
MKTKTQKIRKFDQAYMNPISPTKDTEGNYHTSSLLHAVKCYEITLSNIAIIEKELERLRKELEKYENNPSSRYARLMNKVKDEEEIKELVYRIQGIEEIYNKIYINERKLRESKRYLAVTFPSHIMEEVKQELIKRGEM